MYGMEIIWDTDTIERQGRLTVSEAECLCDFWHSIAGDRDSVVQAAWRAGLSKAEIHRRTGLSRDTVAAIIAGGAS